MVICPSSERYWGEAHLVFRGTVKRREDTKAVAYFILMLPCPSFLDPQKKAFPLSDTAQAALELMILLVPGPECGITGAAHHT